MIVGVSSSTDGISNSTVMYRAINNGQGGGGPLQAVNSFRVVISYAGASAEVISGVGCTVDNSVSRLTIARSAPAGTELATENTCTVRFTYSGVVIFSEIGPERQFRNLNGTLVNGTVSAGSVAVQPTGNVAPGLQFNPEILVQFPRGNRNVLIQRAVRVRALGGAGGVGAASVQQCGVYRGTTSTSLIAGIFGVPGWFFSAPADSDQPITVQCIPTDVDQVGLMYCQRSQNPGSTVLQLWTMRCPAGLADNEGIFSDGSELPRS